MPYREESTFAEIAETHFGSEDALFDWLVDERAGGQSYEAIAHLLSNRINDRVSAATVRRWCLRHEIEP